jgi:hypothetical protein
MTLRRAILTEHTWASQKSCDFLRLCRSGPSFPIGLNDENVIEEALPTDFAFIPVLPPESVTEPDGQPTSDCHEFVTWPVPRCSLLKHADDSHRFLKGEIVLPGAGRDDFTQLITKRFDLCELHDFG